MPNNVIRTRQAPAGNLSQEEEKLVSAACYDKIMSGDQSMEKEAIDAVNDFIRWKVREESFLDEILPPLPLANDELDRQYESDGNVKIVDIEPDSPGAISVPLGSSPATYFMRGRRAKVQMDRKETPRYQKDVSSLRTWIMDIRQVISDNIIKDLHTERDKALMSAANRVLGAVPGYVNPLTGAVMYQSMPGGIDRNTSIDMLKITADTPFSIETKTVLTNHITIKDFAKLDRQEFGGDLAESVMKTGVGALEGLLGLDWIVTIKKALIPNRSCWLWPHTDFLGKHYQLEPPTMHIKREAFMLEFFGYEESGMTLIHIGSFGRADFP